MVNSEIWLNILKSSPLPIAVFSFSDYSNSLIFANTAYSALLGIQEEDLVNKSVTDIFLSKSIHLKEDLIPYLVTSFEKVFNSGLPDKFTNAELSVRYSDSAVPETFFMDMDHTPVKVEGVVKYVSQSLVQLKKSAAGSFQTTDTGADPLIRAELIETILRNLPIGIAVNQIDSGEATFVNHQFSKAYGWSERDLVDFKTFFNKVYPEPIYREKILKRVLDDIQSGEVSRMEWDNIEVTTSTGEKRIINAKNIPLFDQNLMISTVVDITLQARQAEEIRKAKVNQETLINSSNDLIWSVDTDSKIITANKAFLNNLKHATGRDLKEGDLVLDNIYGDDVNRKWKEYYDRALGGESYTIKENYFSLLRNRIEYSVVSFSPMRNEHGKIFGAACYSKDITNDTIALIALQKARNETHKIMESSLDVICTIDADGCFASVSAAAYKIWGFHPEELVGRRYMDLVCEEDIALTIEASRDIMGGTEMTNFENRYVKKDGSLVSMVWSARWDDTDQIMYCIAKDATEREKVFQRIKDNESKLLAAQKIAKVGYWQSFPDSKELYWSDEVYNIWGLDKHTFNLDYESHFNTIHPDDREEFLSSREKALKEGVQHDVEHRIILPDGSIKWVHALGNLIKDDQGEVKVFEGTVQDITKDKLGREKWKKAQEELEESNARYEYVTRATSDAIWDWDLRTDEMYRGSGFQTLFGYSFENVESRGTFLEEHIHPEDLKDVLQNIETVIKGNQVTWILEYRIRKSNGKYAFVQDKGILIRDKSGTPIKMVGAMQDISENKIAEKQKLLHAETSKLFNQPDALLNDILGQVLQHILNYGDIAVAEIWLPSSDKRQIILSSRCTIDPQFDSFYEESFEFKRFGSGEGLPGKVWESREVELWDNIDADLKFLRHVAAKNAALKTAVGLPLVYNDEFIGVLVLVHQGKGESLLEHIAFRAGFCQHLSSEIKRKQLDQELKQIFSFAPDVISVAGTDGYFKKINPAACEMLEYSEEELLSKPVTDFVHPDDKNTTRQVVRSLVTRLDTFYFENRYITKSGKVIWLAWTSTPSPEEGLIFAVAKNITEKKNLEVLLEKSNSLAEIGSWEMDIKNNTLYWSSVTKQIHEIDADFEPDFETAINFYMEGYNRDSIRKALEQSLKDGTAWDMELQIVTAKGNSRWVRALGEAEFVNGKCLKLYGSFQNITHRKVAELELLKIYDEKNTILESIQDGFYTLDKNWVVTYWNHEAENLLLLKRSEVLNKNLWEVFEDAIELKFYSEYHRAVEYNVPVRFEEYFAPRESWFEVSAFPSEDGLTVYFRDVTNRKNIELELLQFKKIIDNSRDGIAIVDLEGKVTYLNPAFSGAIGFDPVIHDHPESIYANRKLVGQVFDTLLSGNYWQGDVEVKTHAGELISYYLSGGPVFDEEGQLKAVYGIHTDITERKHAEQKIRKAYYERNTILESIGDGFFAVDKNWVVSYWNKEAEKLLGVTKKQTLGNHLWKVFDNMTESTSYLKYQEAIDTNQVVHFVDYYPSMHKWYEVSAYPSVDGLSVFFKDITERKIYDIQVRELNGVLRTKVKELAVSNRELEQFAYVASHDLQEPLRMISSFLTQLQRKYDDKLDAKAHQYIHFAVDGAKRMRQIILDLLDFSRVGRDDTEKELVNLNEVINEILILFRKNIEDTKALFVISDLPSISVPRPSIRQLFQNLVSNALKYQSPDESPLIEIGFTEKPDYWEFWVKDNGIGISSDYFDKIFIIFQRLHTKDQFSGTGMGLAICRKIVENLGGKLWVESEEGECSTFYFTIPKATISMTESKMI